MKGMITGLSSKIFAHRGERNLCEKRRSWKEKIGGRGVLEEPEIKEVW